MPRAAPHDLRRLSDRLRALSLQPGEQAAFAAEIIRDVRDGALLNSALAVLGAHPVREAHDALAEVYAYLAASPEKRDAGGYLRMAAVNALRQIAALSDLAIFERATTTYEFSVQERGSPTVLRAAGLVALNQLDARLAGQYAARLLAERDRMSDMNGEPTRTAAAVLAAMGTTLPLLVIALEGTHHPEVLAESIRAQVDIPLPILDALRKAIVTADNPTTDLAWIDLLATHEDIAACAARLAGVLSSNAEPDIYRYAVTTAIASRKLPLVEAVIAAAGHEIDRDRLDILVDALPLTVGQADTTELVQSLTARLGDGKRGR